MAGVHTLTSLGWLTYSIQSIQRLPVGQRLEFESPLHVIPPITETRTIWGIGQISSWKLLCASSRSANMSFYKLSYLVLVPFIRWVQIREWYPADQLAFYWGPSGPKAHHEYVVVCKADSDRAYVSKQSLKTACIPLTILIHIEQNSQLEFCAPLSQGSFWQRSEDCVALSQCSVEKSGLQMLQDRGDERFYCEGSCTYSRTPHACSRQI